MNNLEHYLNLAKLENIVENLEKMVCKVKLEEMMLGMMEKLAMLVKLVKMVTLEMKVMLVMKVTNWANMQEMLEKNIVVMLECMQEMLDYSQVKWVNIWEM
jgi:hypothetical protein